MKNNVSDVFAALADETRRTIYDELLRHDRGLTATELAAEATVSRQAIVKHLQILVRSGLTNAQRDGREVRYFVETGGTADASKWLEQRASGWDRRIAKLERNVRAVPKD